MWSLEVNAHESVFSFSHVSSREAICLGSKHREPQGTWVSWYSASVCRNIYCLIGKLLWAEYLKRNDLPSPGTCQLLIAPYLEVAFYSHKSILSFVLEILLI